MYNEAGINLKNDISGNIFRYELKIRKDTI